MRISSACEIFDASAPGSAPSTHPSAWKKHTRKYAVAISGPRHLQMANTAGGLAPRVPPAPDVATNAARKRGKRLRLYIAGLFKNSGSHPLAGARPH